MLILEPETAVVYSLDHQKQQGFEIKERETLLVVDAGGGTVDPTSHTIKKYTPGSGAPCRSSYLDDKFLNSYLIIPLEPSEIIVYGAVHFRLDNHSKRLAVLNAVSD